MNNFKIKLTAIADVQDFVRATNMQMCDIDLVSGRYVVDAKSIMGLFSLDLTKEVEVQVHGTAADGAAFYEAVKRYVVE